jgi:CheY-like chemotaxis protein
MSEKKEKIETRRQKHAAEDASRAKSQFLATMSHEIRTPMNGVIGMLEMLRDTPLNENQKHYIDVIHRSGETLLEIINDILDYSKIEAGKMLLEVAAFDLEDLVEDSIQLFGATANKRGIELLGGIDPGTPLQLKGDPTRLRQIIINLLGNAFKFTTEGYVILNVGIEDDSDPDRPRLRFTVSDSGIGIDKSAQTTLFDSFNQADSSTSRKYGGTGLGLAICKSLAELMGGSIGVKSVKGQGAGFWFTAEFQLAERRTGVLPTPPEQRLAGKKLLLAGSSKLSEFILRHCGSWKLNLHSAASAAEVLAALDNTADEELYDFIALDDQLPDTDGLSLAAEIRQREGLQTVPLLIFNLGDTRREQALQANLGPHALLRRPLSARTLRQELETLLGHTHRRRAQPRPKDQIQDYSRFAHLRVLVAEDNAVNRMVIKGLLSKLQIEPDLVEDGIAAYNAVRNNPHGYDLILMDCDMPEMDGFEATRSIREYERSRALTATPIVALTAHAMQEHREAVFACGMNYYLGKPVTLSNLCATLEKTGLVKVPRMTGLEPNP